MAGTLSSYSENKVAELLVGKTAFALPSAYVALYTTAPSLSAGTEVASANAYTRISTTGANWGVASGGSTSNTTALTFPTASGAWGTIVAFGILDAVTAGNLLASGWLVTGNPIVYTGKGSSDLFTAPGHGLTNDTQVVSSPVPGIGVPTGIDNVTIYYVVGVAGDNFQLATTQGGTPINFTTDGAGILYRAVPKVIATGDIVQFNVGALSLSLT